MSYFNNERVTRNKLTPVSKVIKKTTAAATAGENRNTKKFTNENISSDSMSSLLNVTFSF